MNDKEYYFGKCNYCGKVTALKNGICEKCQEKLPDIFKEMFKDIVKEESNEKNLS